MSKELLKLFRNSGTYTKRKELVQVYDLVLKILKDNLDKNIGQLTILLRRHGIYDNTFIEMLDSFVLNKEIEIYGQGEFKEQFVRILEPIEFQDEEKES